MGQPTTTSLAPSQLSTTASPSSSTPTSSGINNNANVFVINVSNSNTFDSDESTNREVVDSDESVLGSASELSVVPHVAPTPDDDNLPTIIGASIGGCCLLSLIALLVAWAVRRKRRNKPSENVIGYFDAPGGTQREASSMEHKTCRESSEDLELATSRRFSSVDPKSTVAGTDADASASLPHQQIYAEPMPQPQRVINYDSVMGIEPSSPSQARISIMDYGSMPNQPNASMTAYGSMPEKDDD